jgi:hypothetical protein
MVINVDSTKEVYKAWKIKTHENGIVEVEGKGLDLWVWSVVDHLIGENPHLIPMSIARDTDLYGVVKVAVLFVEKSVFGHQNPNLP